MDCFSVKNHGGIKNKIPKYNNNIPDDCLYLIYKKLDKKPDQDSFGLTCHRFLDIQNSCRKRLRILPLSGRPDNTDDDTFILEKLLNRFRELESLSFRGCGQLTDSVLTKLKIYGSKLSVVSLSKCQSLTDDGLNILTSSKCVSLMQLDLGWCPNITDLGIAYLNRNCRQLKALRVSGCVRILGQTFQGFSPTLNCLEAKHCAFDSSRSLACILSGGGLNYLNLSFPICYPSWRHELAVIGLGFAANLKILDLSGCNHVEDDAITEISKGCPLLQEWNLFECHHIDTRGWESIGLYCQNLETLDVRGCRRFGDRDLAALANGCKSLSVLYMTDNSHLITPSGIQNFKMKRQGAVELRVEPIRQFTTTTTTTSWSDLATSS